MTNAENDAIEAVLSCIECRDYDALGIIRTLRAAIKRVKDEEREACAKHIEVPYIREGHEFAAAIRNRETP